MLDNKETLRKASRGVHSCTYTSDVEDDSTSLPEVQSSSRLMYTYKLQP